MIRDIPSNGCRRMMSWSWKWIDWASWRIRSREKRKTFPCWRSKKPRNDRRSFHPYFLRKTGLAASRGGAPACLFRQHYRRVGAGQPEPLQFLQYVLFYAPDTYFFAGAASAGQYNQTYLGECAGRSGSGDQYR